MIRKSAKRSCQIIIAVAKKQQNSASLTPPLRPPLPPPLIQCLKNLQTCGQLTEMTAMHQNVDLSNVRPISNRIIIITTNVGMI